MQAHSTIDIHAHFYPAGYLRLIEKHGSDFGAGCDFSNPEGPQITLDGLLLPPLTEAFIDIDARIAEMDALGVAVHALSLTMPMVGWAGDNLALQLSEAFNDGIGEAHQKYPDRLIGFATLPWHAPELAVKELDRAAKIPGIRGVYSATRGASTAPPGSVIASSATRHSSRSMSG